MRYRGLLIAIVIVMLSIASFGASITFIGMPQSNAGAMAFVGERDTGPILWEYWLDDEKHISVIDLGITQDEFRESMENGTMRYATFLDPASIHTVDPDDRYVRMIADMILAMTDDDCQRAVIALNFVQTGIEYVYDWDNYGSRNFAATPLETLYMRTGDCEDTSILLTSIYLAMGLDCELLDYPEHVAVGVRWDDDMEYLYCETTFDFPSSMLFPLSGHTGGLHEYPMGSIPDVCLQINDWLWGYRNLIKRFLGL